MGMKKSFGLMAMALGIMGGLDGMSSPMDNNSKLSLEDIDFTPKKAPIPKGCKEYFFNSLGDFINKNDGLYCFKCVAASDKSALKKFEKWVEKQGVSV